MSKLRWHPFAALGAVAAILGVMVAGGQADAAVVVNVYQSGDNVVATGNGRADLTDLAYDVTALAGVGAGAVWGAFGAVFVAPSASAEGEVYLSVSGPASFGTGGLATGSSGSGDMFGVIASPLAWGAPALIVPAGYVSGTSLSGSSIFDGVTIASLGLTPGTYVYTWGTSADADSLTVNIEAVPEPSTWTMMLLGFAGLGFAGHRRGRRLA
jgi:PEP-CTERM motif